MASVDSEQDQEDVKPLTAEQAQALRERQPFTSPWRVLALQAVAGLLVAVLAWVVVGKTSVGWSVAYGALTVVIPGVVFARGMTSRLTSINPATAVAAVLVWEMVKIALTVAMLLAAPRLVEELSWPAMLVSMVVTMQVYWAALWLAPKKHFAKRLTNGQIKDGS